MNQNIENIVIVGGGSAGWMTAAMLAKQLNKSINITLVESEEIGTIGVGEATIPPIRHFNQLLGVEENDFLAKCNGSIKLGIEFENWGAIGDKYMHPFGSFGVDFDYMPFPYFWLQQKLTDQVSDLQSFSLAWQLAQQNKFLPPNGKASSLGNQHDYAYHFDATLYVQFLKRFTEKLGVNRIEGKVTQVTINPDNQFIDAVKLQSGQIIEGDLFIDCSGQHGLLLDKTYGVEFEDWSPFLLNDSAVAVQSAHLSALKPYTRSIAHEAGWQWRIPLQHRTGNGLVYCERYLGRDEAAERLLANVEGETLTDPLHIRFHTGARRKQWHKNCVVVGLAGGFMEPLESTSIHLIQKSIMRLVRLLPTTHLVDADIREFNDQTYEDMITIRDFLILHYHVTERRDSAFWRFCAEMEIPDSLQQKIDLFCESARVFRKGEELFAENSWTQVMMGQGLEPKSYHPIADKMTDDELTYFLNQIKADASRAAARLPKHEEYIRQYCASADVMEMA